MLASASRTICFATAHRPLPTASSLITVRSLWSFPESVISTSMQRAKSLIRLTCLSLVGFGLLSVAAGQDVKRPARLELTPCQVTGVTEKVLCGTYEVFEDRAARKGRKITLKVVVFPATGPAREPDPFVYIPGGPGSSATEDAPGIAQVFASIRTRRDHGIYRSAWHRRLASTGLQTF